MLPSVIFLISWTLACSVNSELSTTVNEDLQSYKSFINASIDLERQDKLLMNTWMENLQVNQVNITSVYRLQLTRHKENCFRTKRNQRWRNCIEIYKNEIKKTDKKYYDKESECLKVSISADKEKKHAVNQIEKEIRKWRKSYRYLQNLCNTNHSGDDEEAGVCLVEYMNRDNYNLAIQRLLILKLESMGELDMAITKSAVLLEICLKTSFSEYLASIRSVMVILNRCYDGTRSV